MKIVYSDAHVAHHPRFFLVRGLLRESPEVPGRFEHFLEAVRDTGNELIPPCDFGLEPIRKVHPTDYLDFLATAWAEWSKLPDAGPEIVPNMHPNRVPGTYPAHIVGRAGWHAADTAAPIGPNTWAAALTSAHQALTAADLVLAGELVAYALCRPPGHHCYADMAGGFCFLNNAAIATEHLRARHERVAILDVDLHHGNGTQGIFYRRGDVLTVSIHADPARLYPWFWGHAHERGEGPGDGANINLPLALGSGDAPFLDALGTAIDAIGRFGASALVVALGLDASKDDPFGGLAVTTEGFVRIGERIGRMRLPTLLVHEGGYLSPSLGANLAAFLKGLDGAR